MFRRIPVHHAKYVPPRQIKVSKASERYDSENRHVNLDVTSKFHRPAQFSFPSSGIKSSKKDLREQRKEARNKEPERNYTPKYGAIDPLVPSISMKRTSKRTETMSPLTASCDYEPRIDAVRPRAPAPDIGHGGPQSKLEQHPVVLNNIIDQMYSVKWEYLAPRPTHTPLIKRMAGRDPVLYPRTDSE
ncbi:hypothetical protein PAPYR_13457 [Paratrimastix pyriformis]|uniref:Uncharacterized protein n=1 Tax=Paratrimastix pyriformis TaxID=342808 RepID=A0ABQ8U523_9EUKA|nr:hypothetical protein PAPYR_13457 [Paratrimastix pyriformis]